MATTGATSGEIGGNGAAETAQDKAKDAAA